MLWKIYKIPKTSELNHFAAEREFIGIKEHGPCVICKGTGKYIHTSIQKSTKFLCVGGPWTGQRSTQDDMVESYTLYNVGGRGSKNYKTIWVYAGSLKG